MQLKLIMQLSLHLKLRLGLKLTLKRTLWIALDQKSSKPNSKVQAETKSFFKYHCHSQVLAYSEAKSLSSSLGAKSCTKPFTKNSLQD